MSTCANRIATQETGWGCIKAAEAQCARPEGCAFRGGVACPGGGGTERRGGEAQLAHIAACIAVQELERVSLVEGCLALKEHATSEAEHIGAEGATLTEEKAEEKGHYQSHITACIGWRIEWVQLEEEFLASKERAISETEHIGAEEATLTKQKAEEKKGC
ncbi:hypothetical protein K438DRAFT_1767113 [Mycena galopus ATCC 62051]|nr:hypothetical protein K438DRAFT_1767113 [Mycena galopus ATCC 62051]